MKLIQGPIGRIDTHYICDTEVKKIIGTNRKGKLKTLDMQKGVF